MKALTLPCSLFLVLSLLALTPRLSFADDDCSAGLTLKAHLPHLIEYFGNARRDPLGTKRNFCGTPDQSETGLHHERWYLEGYAAFLYRLEEASSPVGVSPNDDGTEGLPDLSPAEYWARRVFSLGIYGAQLESSKKRESDAHRLRKAVLGLMEDFDFFCMDGMQPEFVPGALSRVIESMKAIPPLGETLLQDFGCKSTNVSASRAPSVSAGALPGPVAESAAGSTGSSATRAAAGAR